MTHFLFVFLLFWHSTRPGGCSHYAQRASFVVRPPKLNCFTDVIVSRERVLRG